MTSINDLMNQAWFSLILMILVVAGFAFSLSINKKYNNIKSLLDQLGANSSSENLEQTLRQLFSRLDQLGYNLNQLGTIQQEIRSRLRLGVQKVETLRFNPFEDTGGDQSFAVALLDEQNNGLILSSLHARDGTRVYAKPITAGKSPYPLAEEEKEVLRKAILK